MTANDYFQSIPLEQQVQPKELRFHLYMFQHWREGPQQNQGVITDIKRPRLMGSSLQVLGNFAGKSGQLAIVGGTGELAFAHGVATATVIQEGDGDSIRELQIRAMCLAFLKPLFSSPTPVASDAVERRKRFVEELRVGGGGLLAEGETCEETGRGIAPMLKGNGGRRLHDGRRRVEARRLGGTMWIWPEALGREGGVEGYSRHGSLSVTKIGPWGGNGGKEFNIPESVPQPRRLESVTIRSGIVINSIAFSYVNQAGNKQTLGPWGGDGEHTGTEVSGTTGAFGGDTVVTSLSFVTNVKTYGPFGTPIGTAFSVPLTDTNVVGFFVRAGRFLNALGVYARSSIQN
uniref:Dirigent protein n=1 Tax=Aegilops tauschii TaxID=37682 RepID=R7WFG1_AEGTA